MVDLRQRVWFLCILSKSMHTFHMKKVVECEIKFEFFFQSYHCWIVVVVNIPGQTVPVFAFDWNVSMAQRQTRTRYTQRWPFFFLPPFILFNWIFSYNTFWSPLPLSQLLPDSSHSPPHSSTPFLLHFRNQINEQRQRKNTMQARLLLNSFHPINSSKSTFV